jgi:hypothetical protein
MRYLIMDQTQDYQKVLDDYAKTTSADLNPTSAPEPVAPPISPTPPPPLSPPPLPTSIPPQASSGFDPFKYAFFLSLIIFLGVITTLGYNLYKQYSVDSPVIAPPATSKSPTPSIIATPTSTAVCQLNEKSYHVNETFLATDGCNSCTCGEDLTISCTELDCSSPSIPTDWKTYENKNLGFSLKYSSNWNLSIPTSNDNQNRIFFLHKDSQKLMIPGFSIEKTSKTPQEIMNPFLNEVATPDNKKAKPETVTVSGIKATKMIFDTAEGGLISLIYLTYGGSQYVIDLPIYGDQLDVETTQILSTLKFL